MKKSILTVFCFVCFAGLLPAETLISQTFDDEMGRISVSGSLKRANFVRVEAGSGAIGADPAAHFLDDSTTESGVLEYCVSDPAAAYLISFDVLNNQPASELENARLIFSTGQHFDGKSFVLSGGAKRAFSVEFEQAASSKALSIRIGTATAKKSSYDTAALQQVKIWVNDNDKKELSYIRPDNQQAALLGPDSVVVWINDVLVVDQKDSGIVMQSSISAGDKVLGRLGFSSTTTSTVDFLIDNVHVESVSQ